MNKKIINLILLLLTAVCFVAGVAFMAASIVYSRNNTEEMGVTVLYSKSHIPAGTVLSADNVADYIGAKMVKGIDAVPSAITLNGSSKTSFVGAVLEVFFPKPLEISDETLSGFVGLQAITTVSENVQLEGKYFSKNDTEPDERLFSIPMDYKLGLGGEIQVGDIVDLWVYRDSKTVKVYSDAVVFKLKGENNVDITPDTTEKPVLAIFKLTEDSIAQVRNAQGDGSIFLVKHGVR